MGLVTFSVSDPHYNEWLYLFLLIIPLSLFFIGKKEGKPYIILAGFVITLYGIAVFMGYFPRLPDNFMIEGLSVVLFGLGFYFMVSYGIKYIKEVE